MKNPAYMKYVIRILHRAVELLQKKIEKKHFDDFDKKVKVITIVSTIHAIIEDLDSL